MSIERDDDWMRGAACRGMSGLWFYPYPRDAPDFNVDDAKHWNDANREICGGCNVKSECLQYALDNRIEFDVWGGESPVGRHRLMGRKK
jgi:WhiB family redox-sensing transcriptional regulator